MEDILITDIQEFEEITDSVILEKEVPVSVSDDNLRKEIIEGGEPIDKSDTVILSSNVINNRNSLKSISISNSVPDIPINPSVSGNVVNNYYISLSGNGVSYNLIDKPLNEYTPTESMFALSILFALGIGFVILCRKAVFRWK